MASPAGHAVAGAAPSAVGALAVVPVATAPLPAFAVGALAARSAGFAFTRGGVNESFGGGGGATRRIGGTMATSGFTAVGSPTAGRVGAGSAAAGSDGGSALAWRHPSDPSSASTTRTPQAEIAPSRAPVRMAPRSRGSIVERQHRARVAAQDGSAKSKKGCSTVTVRNSAKSSFSIREQGDHLIERCHVMLRLSAGH